MRTFNLDAHHKPLQNIVGDLGICSSLNLVIDRRLFIVVNLFLRDESVLLATDYTLLFTFWPLLSLQLFGIC